MTNLLQLGVNKLSKYQCPQDTLARHFNHLVALNSVPNQMVLDAGCGERPIISRNGSKAIIGVDYDGRITENKSVDILVQGNLYTLPFEDKTFNTIVCYMVVEHLFSPLWCFQEFYRVCKDKARIIIATPNQNHYATRLVKTTPHWSHRWFCKHILKSKDDHRTYFRANDAKTLRRLMEQAGFRTVNIHHVDAMPFYGYLGWFTPFYLLGLWWHRVLRKSHRLRNIRGDIFGIFEKQISI